jgi:single-strand DNA-binding protein
MPTDQSTSAANQVVLSGVFAGEAVLRTLPSGDELVSFRITVARPPGERARVDKCRAGDSIELTGSLRRRFWRAASGGPASRYEVEVATLKRPPTRRTPVR